MHVCTKCGKEKPWSEFYREGNGYQSRCKPCERARVREYAGRRSPEENRRINLKAFFSLTPYDVVRMHSDQGGKCAICERVFTLGRMAVDHDDRRGFVRALLCAVCNRRLGHVEDAIHGDGDFAPRALRYLAAYIDPEGRPKARIRKRGRRFDAEAISKLCDIQYGRMSSGRNRAP